MGQSNKDVFVGILRDIARQVAAFDDAEFDDVVSGQAKIQVSVERKKTSTTNRPKKMTDDECVKVIQTLRELDSRDAGTKLLDERATTRDELTRMARCLDVPVRKGDGQDVLRSRIIEATIGFRLNSAAIQGHSRPDDSATESGSETKNASGGTKNTE